MLKSSVLLFAMLISTIGCERTVGASPEANRIGRFVPIPGLSVGEVALDTQTGQACRTVDWKPMSGLPNMYADSPLCADLYWADWKAASEKAKAEK